MEKKYSILIVDDEIRSLELLERLLVHDYRILKAKNGKEALRALEQEKVEMAIVDQRMPEMTGIEFFEKTLEQHPYMIKILLTAYTDVDALIDAINKGRVYKYITKPWDPNEFKVIVKRALEYYDLTLENIRLNEELTIAYEKLKKDYNYLQKELEGTHKFDQIITVSPTMQKIFRELEKIIDSSITVLILGETGTGKELVAQTIHYNSPRKSQKFVAQNCGSLPETLLESELFGYKKGSFTGAVADKKGLLEIADKGTVFLDEIGETSPAMQVRLLRFLEEGEIRPIGSESVKKLDVRVISATNKDLFEEVAAGRFRKDLYYRLSTFPIILPPLRERKEDIPLLSEHFLLKYSRKTQKYLHGFSPEALSFLEMYDFPGNIRELENEVERAVALAEPGTFISPDLLSDRVRGHQKEIDWLLNKEGKLTEKVELLERRIIEKLLNDFHGNKSEVARQLGLSRLGLRKKMARYGLKK
ncbi:MAG: sigma-54-dependent Fis family transcriptional regulator [Nitrospinae bacterium]|nr:sigma-54-dependent Fis family transcriptional regulator [Nitrospinota bacterium]